MRTGVHFVWRLTSRVRLSHTIVIGMLSLGLISCAYAPKPRGGIENYPGWSMASQAQGRTAQPQRPVMKKAEAPRQTPVRKVSHTLRYGPYEPLKSTLPKIPNAEFVREDELCMTCHESHVKFFQEKNVHREFSCEECHGPASEHIGTRGQEDGKILNVRRLGPAERSEICLRCHDKEVTPPHVANWRTSVHANKNVSCSDCHRAHHDVPKGTPTVTPPQTSTGPRPGKVVASARPTPRAADPLVRPAAASAATASAVSRALADDKAKVRKKPSLRGTSREPGVGARHVLPLPRGIAPHDREEPPHQLGSGPAPGFKCATCHDAEGTITEKAGRETCLSCHGGAHAANWMGSTHNQAGMLCTDCHRPHPQVTPQAAADLAKGVTTGIPRSMAVGQVATCVKCHEETKLIVQLPNPHQVGGPNNFQCSTCHDPHGKVLDSTRRDVCLNCHTGNLSSAWHTSTHNQAGLVCTDCHKPHPALNPQAVANLNQGVLAGLPKPMAVSQANTCVRCHEQTKQLVEIADAHQVGGKNGFQCTTCHDPHGKIIESTRKELCLNCHKGTPTAAWHSSVHNLQGIACTDCHDPHPDTHPQQNVDIRHTNIRRPQRKPMSVNDPDTCYKCHPQNYGQSLMPSHHPIFEGKMNCSSCHDSHGQALKLLKEPTVNLVCYKCHSEVQGPFVYEHPPVTQDCSICHDPHGTVERRLLRQPATFLCLRCHSGHRNGPPFHDAGLLPDIGTSPRLQKAFYTDCTQCHSQIHGSDVPSPSRGHTFAR